MILRRNIQILNTLYYLVLVCVALLPLFCLFWQVKFFSIKLNWLLYPFVLSGVFITVMLRRKAPLTLFLSLFLILFYLLLTWINGGEVETIFRFFIAILPLIFYSSFSRNSPSSKSNKYFWWIYAASFALPLYNAYLQHTGQMPYDDFDVVAGEYIGRVSGGYDKPMNFIAFLLPIYLGGFYLWKVRKRKWTGLILIGLILALIYIIGHRTSLFAFVMILVSSFFTGLTISCVKIYYKYFLNFFIGIGSLIFFRVLLSTVGIVDIIRGRVPIWEAHSEQFFDSGIFKILFGSQKIWLFDDYRYPGIELLDEVHNNSFRTILFFGVIGFFLYCLFMRFIVMTISRLDHANELKFVIFSGYTYFIFYTITNEPVYYAAILWPVLIWAFLALTKPGQLNLFDSNVVV